VASNYFRAREKYIAMTMGRASPFIILNMYAPTKGPGIAMTGEKD
jgi:hypothetical protein